MKAIFPWTLGLLGLIAFVPLADSYVFVSPVYKRPYPPAPNTCTGQIYYVDPWGRLIGPHYYLHPCFPPVGTELPGPIGKAIMAGNLPHTLLMSKGDVDLGDAPLLKDRKKEKPHGAPPPPPQAPNPNQGAAPFQYPSVGGVDMQRYGNVQQPYGMMPMGPYAVPMGPPPPQMMPMPMPMPAPMPVPVSRPSGPVAYYWPMSSGIYQAQMMAPMQPMSPRMPTMVPSVDPRMPMLAPMQPMMPPMDGRIPMMPGMQPFAAPMQPMQPMVPVAPMPPYMGSMQPLAQPFAPMNPLLPVGPLNPLLPLTPLQPLAPPIPPMAQMQPLQLPRMDMAPPPLPQQNNTAYPTHPFTRSPRDFFMWSDVMEEERARGRGFPAP